MNKPSVEMEEEIEGLGDPEDASWGDYPIDTLLIRNENRTVHDVLRRIEKNAFIMDPDFQRDFIWSRDKQSKLIESVLLRIPLPVFYLAEDDQGRMIVVDGLQRLTTFQRFVNNEFKLQLPEQPELNNKHFKDLSAKLQNRVEDCNLILYVIDAKVPEQARLDIFERVNGGVPLTRQQMRNCLFMGEATRFLKEEANTEVFLQATGKSLKTNTMRDREFVNRFCAFQILSLDQYKGDMDDFLALSLRKMNKMTSEELAQLSARFRLAMSNARALFGKFAFRKHQKGQTARSVLNASLWDILSTALSHHSEAQVKTKKAALLEAFYTLMDDDEFIHSITYGPNSTKQVKHRFTVMNKVMEDVFNA